jgi:hypothetical protein
MEDWQGEMPISKKELQGHIGRAKFLSQLDVSGRYRGSSMKKNAKKTNGAGSARHERADT